MPKAYDLENSSPSYSHETTQLNGRRNNEEESLRFKNLNPYMPRSLWPSHQSLHHYLQTMPIQFRPIMTSSPIRGRKPIPQRLSRQAPTTGKALAVILAKANPMMHFGVN